MLPFIAISIIVCTVFSVTAVAAVVGLLWVMEKSFEALEFWSKPVWTDRTTRITSQVGLRRTPWTTSAQSQSAGTYVSAKA